MKYSLFIIISLCCSVSFAQKYTLSGTVKNMDNQAIAGATLYVAGSKMSTTTDNEGRFQFQLERGNYDILTQMMGYGATNTQVSIAAAVQVHIKLLESTYKISEVIIRPNPERVRYINLFKDYFLGKTPNALLTKILNPEVLKVDYDKESKVLKVSSDQLLKIENSALGYNINYLIANFEYNFATNVVFYEGYPAFEDMIGKRTQQNRWEKAREKAYLGSPTHFLKTLAKKTSYEEGYLIYKISGGTHPLQAKPSLGVSLGGNMDMLSTQPVRLDTLVKHIEENFYGIQYTDDLYVVYTKEREPADFQWTGFKMNRTAALKDYQVSRIIALKQPVYFYNSGLSADPTATLHMGHFAWEKFADLLPIEYEVGKKK